MSRNVLVLLAIICMYASNLSGQSSDSRNIPNTSKSGSSIFVPNSLMQLDWQNESLSPLEKDFDRTSYLVAGFGFTAAAQYGDKSIHKGSPTYQSVGLVKDSDSGSVAISDLDGTKIVKYAVVIALAVLLYLLIEDGFYLPFQ